MDERRVVNPRLLLSVGILVGFLFSAIAIYFAVIYTPDSGRESGDRDLDPAVAATATARIPAGNARRAVYGLVGRLVNWD